MTPLPTSYVLIGPPGSGKSTVGELLATQLGLSFVDTDHAIEEMTQKSISEIFVDDGEGVFRGIEERVVLEALQSESGVISLGGGSILSEAVRAELVERKPNRVIVFLDVSISSAAPRIGFNASRPLLMINPRSQWQELMNHRRKIYVELADLIVDTNDISPDEVALQVQRAGVKR
jgi:shikimate kinase